MKQLSKDLLEQLDYYLVKAIQEDGADMGNIQLFDAGTQTLKIVAQSGFRNEFLNYFKVVKAFDTSACGRAVGIGSPVIIEDVMLDIAFIPHREIAKSAGFRCVKSVPIVSNDNNLLGIISTHYKHPKWNWDMDAINPVIKHLSELLYLQTA